MSINKEEIISYLNKANVLINEKDLSMKQIYNYTFIKNKHGVAFEYFDFNNKYRSLSFAKVNKDVRKYASIISNLIGNEGKHNAVVLKYTNSPEWCEIFYAILMAGYKPLLVNAKTSKEGVNNLIRQAKAVAVISDDPFKYDVKKIHIDEIVLAKKADGFVSDWENEVIFCSSGTTGDVKMMVFNGENLCHQIASSLKMGYTTKDIMYPNKFGKIKILAMIPFHHIFGFVAVFLWYSFYGKTIVFPSSMNSKEIQKLCVDHKITHVYSVPLFWDSLALQYKRSRDMAEEPIKGYLDALQHMNLHVGAKLHKIVIRKILDSMLGNNIRMCISGGGYLSEDTATIVNGIGYPLYNGYGMTEIGVTSVELSPILRVRLECGIGKPFHGVTYKIANNENSGELLVKSKAIHVKEIIGGVVKNTELDEEGFFHTGDIASVNDDGNYSIKGRVKDIIINADGENIFPDELELYFKNVSDINAYTILGVRKNKKDTNELVTFVGNIKSNDADVVGNVMMQINEAAKHLPNGVKLDQVFFTLNPLPTANNMKIKRHEIKKALEEGSKDFFSPEVKVEEKKVVNFSDDVVVNILTPVKKMFAEVLLLKEQDIKNDSHWINDLGGDSMNFFELVTRVNEEFNINIPDERFTSLTSVNDFVEIILELTKE